MTRAEYGLMLLFIFAALVCGILALFKGLDNEERIRALEEEKK